MSHSWSCISASISHVSPLILAHHVAHHVQHMTERSTQRLSQASVARIGVQSFSANEHSLLHS